MVGFELKRKRDVEVEEKRFLLFTLIPSLISYPIAYIIYLLPEYIISGFRVRGLLHSREIRD
jgi:hypothetical protein